MSPAAGRNIGWAGLAAVKGLAAFRLEPDRQTDRSNHDQNELGQTKSIHDYRPSGPAPFGVDCSVFMAEPRRAGADVKAGP